MKTKTIFATVVAITAVLFVVPANAEDEVPGAEVITICLKNGSCEKYIEVKICIEDRLRPENCVTWDIGHVNPPVMADECSKEPDVYCYRWHADDE